jgi:hypothetical protein
MLMIREGWKLVWSVVEFNGQHEIISSIISENNGSYSLRREDKALVIEDWYNSRIKRLNQQREDLRERYVSEDQ